MRIWVKIRSAQVKIQAWWELFCGYILIIGDAKTNRPLEPTGLATYISEFQFQWDTGIKTPEAKDWRKYLFSSSGLHVSEHMWMCKRICIYKYTIHTDTYKHNSLLFLRSSILYDLYNLSFRYLYLCKLHGISEIRRN